VFIEVTFQSYQSYWNWTNVVFRLSLLATLRNSSWYQIKNFPNYLRTHLSSVLDSSMTLSQNFLSPAYTAVFFFIYRPFDHDLIAILPELRLDGNLMETIVNSGLFLFATNAVAVSVWLWFCWSGEQVPPPGYIFSPHMPARIWTLVCIQLRVEVGSTRPHTHPYTRTPTHGAKRYRRREARMVLLFRIILRLIMKIGQILKILTQTTLSSVLPSESPDERTFCPEPRNPEPRSYIVYLSAAVCVWVRKEIAIG